MDRHVEFSTSGLVLIYNYDLDRACNTHSNIVSHTYSTSSSNRHDYTATLYHRHYMRRIMAPLTHKIDNDLEDTAVWKKSVCCISQGAALKWHHWVNMYWFQNFFHDCLLTFTRTTLLLAVINQNVFAAEFFHLKVFESGKSDFTQFLLFDPN